MAINNLANTELTRLLNEEVDPVLKTAINRRVVERTLFKVKTRPVSGKYFLSKSVTGGNFRLGGRPEGGYIPGFNPDALLQDKFSKLKTQETRYKRRYLYTSVDVTGPMRAAPKTPSGGFENIAGLVIKDTVDNLPEMISRKFAVGQAGVLGRISSISGNTVTLVAANAPATAAASYPYAGNRYFREGMVIDCINGSSPLGALRTNETYTKNKGRVIDEVSDDGTTCTLTMNDMGTNGTDNDWAAGDLLVEHGTRQDGAINEQSEFEDGFYDPLGIPDAVQDGSDSLYSMTYMGNLAVASYKTMQSIKVNNTNNANLTVKMSNLLLEKIQYDSTAGGVPSETYCSPSVYRKMAEPFTTQSSTGMSTDNPIRWQQPGMGPVNVGVSGIVVNNFNAGNGSRVFRVSPFAPHFRCFFIAKEELEMLQEREPGFLDDDGLNLRQTPGKDEFTLIWKWYCSGIINKHPRKSGYITGLNGDHNNQ